MNEPAARAAVAQYCRLLWERRLVTGTSGNVSVLLDDGRILVTPTQISLRSVDEPSLVLVDRDGRVAESGGPRPTSELPLHLAAYASRSDAAVVIHTHPTFCVLWSKTGSVFPRDTVGARESLGEVGFAPYHPPGSQQLARASADVFSAGVNAVLMERHGLSAIGTDLESVFNVTDLAEEAARLAFFSKVLFLR